MGAKSSFFSSEIRLKYFISQRIASIFFIFSTLGFLVSAPSIISIIIITSILFKLGIPPFHSWLLSILLISPYKLMVLILIIQKFIPLHIFSSINIEPLLLIWSAIFSLVVISLNLKNINNLRIRLILSAWGNTLWLCIAAVISSSWIIFLFLYGIFLLTVILNLEWLNVQKLASFLSLRYFSKTVRLINFLRLAGLPPLSGFFIKLFLLKVLIFSAPSFLILLLLISSLIVLYAYIIISYYVLRAPFSITNFNTTKTPVLFLRIISLSWGALPILFLLSS